MQNEINRSENNGNESGERKKRQLHFLLSGEAEGKFNRFLGDLKNRGITLDADERCKLMSKAFMNVPEEFWKEEIKNRTPLDFVISAWLKDPQKRKELEGIVELNGGINS